MDLTSLDNLHFSTLKVISRSHLTEESIHLLFIALSKRVEVGLDILLPSKTVIFTTVQMKNRTLLTMK